jgi:hypothetical protein
LQTRYHRRPCALPHYHSPLGTLPLQIMPLRSAENENKIQQSPPYLSKIVHLHPHLSGHHSTDHREARGKTRQLKAHPTRTQPIQGLGSKLLASWAISSTSIAAAVIFLEYKRVMLLEGNPKMPHGPDTNPETSVHEIIPSRFAAFPSSILQLSHRVTRFPWSAFIFWLRKMGK